MLTRFALLAALGLSPMLMAPLAMPLSAETTTKEAPSDSVARLADALRLQELLVVLRQEGIAYGDQLEAEMFPDQGGARWDGAVAVIYDVDRLNLLFLAALEAELGQDPAILTQILAFYDSDLGKRVVELELEARRAFLDTAQEEAARVAAEDRVAARDPNVKLIDRLIAAADLIEMNVAGALSGNLAFMTGMTSTGACGPGVPTEELMADVWGQEDQIRADTSSWLHAYLGLAYDPLTEAELSDYAAFMESAAGQRVNAALFVAFDEAFREVSQNLGRAAGLAMQGRTI